MTPNPTGNLPTPTIVGLGRMGANMARRLARAGLTVHGFDPSAEAREALSGETGVRLHAALAARMASATISPVPG